MAMPDDAEFDARDFRHALARFATGVAIVTTRRPDRHLVGMTVNSFASVSLHPPLVLWSVKRDTPSADTFQDAAHFAVNVLAAYDVDVARRFSRPQVDKFAGLDHAPGLGGAPVLAGAAATFECARWAVYDGGDHAIIVGHVDRFRRTAAPPLVFHAGHYGTTAPLGARA
jgi:flavin reductase (DIM6/NTAB) family NADH-FMN oxidoreductase RutF